MRLLNVVDIAKALFRVGKQEIDHTRHLVVAYEEKILTLRDSPGRCS